MWKPIWYEGGPSCPGGGPSSEKVTGMLIGNFELNL